MRPEAILWDLDGTLCDGASAILDAFQFACDTRRYDVPPREAIVSRIGMPLRLMFRDLLGVDDRESAALVASYRERFEAEAPRLVRLAPGAKEALDAFPRVPMAVVTTKAAEPARTVLRALGLDARM